MSRGTDRGGRVDRPTRHAWLVVPGLLCLAALLVAVGAGPVPLSGDSPLDRIRPLQVEQPADASEETVVDIDPPGSGDEEELLGLPVEVLLAVVVATLALALLARSVLRARQDPPEDDDTGGPPDERTHGLDATALAEAARAGLLRLRDVAPERAADVVVACWVELELAAGATPGARRFTDTPTDFARRLTAAVPGLDTRALDGLRRTYSRVRFAAPGSPERDVTPAQADEARAVLASLLQDVEHRA